jgi:hypothetical protein
MDERETFPYPSATGLETLVSEAVSALLMSGSVLSWVGAIRPALWVVAESLGAGGE